MKTYVRITRGKSGNYDTLTMEVLHPSTFGNYLAPIGTIAWQGDAKFEWYGMRLHVDAELHNHANLLSMHKLAAYIKERAVLAKPTEVMALIGGIECWYDYGMFIPVTEVGKRVYHIRRSKTDSVYTRIISTNEITAQRAIDGMIKRKELLDTYSWIAEQASSVLYFTPTTLEYFATTSKINTNA